MSIAGSNGKSRISSDKLKELIAKRKGRAAIDTPVAKLNKSGKKEFELSSIQKGIWLDCKVDPDSYVYNIPFACKISGNLNIDALKLGITNIIKRQEAWRTIFVESNETIVQKVLEDAVLDFSYFDLTNETADDKVVAEYAKQFVSRPFDLSKNPLVRFALYQTAVDQYYFILAAHHLVYDGSSAGIFCRELSREYLSILGNEASEVAMPEVSYGDYAEYSLSFEQSAEVKKQLNYWINELTDHETVEFPTDRIRPSVRKDEGGMIYFDIDERIQKQLREYAIKNHSTVNVVLFSALSVLLRAYSRIDTTVIGTTVTSREDERLENIIGCFINNLVIKSEITSDMTFDDVMKVVRDKLFMAYANKNVPLTTITENVSVSHDVSKNPFYEVSFNYNPRSWLELELPNCECSEFGLGDFVTLTDVGFQVFDDGNSLGGFVEYNNSIYDRTTIEGILEHYQAILGRVVEASDKKISSIEIITEEEREQILNVFNDTAVAYEKEKTIIELFETQVAKNPDNTAVVFEDQALTYKELNEKANQIARKLRSLGVGADDFVAIMTERSLEMIVGIYGVLKAGGAYVPVDPTYPDDRIAYMLEDCKPKAILSYKADVTYNEACVIDLADSKLYEFETTNLEVVSTPESLAYCIYTSGTTGKPKGVMIKNKNVVNYSADCEINTMGYAFANKLTRFVSVTNMTFDIFVTEILTTLINGMTTYIANSEQQNDLEQFEKLVNKHHIEILQTTPSRIKGLFAQDSETKVFSGMKYIMLGGEAVGADIVRKLKSVTDAVIENVYGPSETTVWSSCFRIDKEYQTIPVGKPVANTKIYIVNKDALCGIGVPGELCIAGDGLARGYLNRPDLTAEKFVDNPFGEGKLYHTGDLARWLTDGNVEYLGRIDEQVKIRGFRIELGEISSKLLEIDKVRDCAVIAKNDVGGDKAIYAYYVSDEELNSSDIRKELSKSLPDYMLPSYMMRIDAIPVNKSGKLDRRALPDIEAKIEREYIAPTNKTEAIICNIFAEILGAEKVSINDSFFELGGHSLRATKLVNRIEAETGVRIALKKVFSNTTPEMLAKLIKESEGEEYVSIPVAEVKDYYPMSSAQKRTYLISQMDPDGILYNITQSFRIMGEVRPDDVKEAVQKLIDRHEILRTSFLMIDGEPMQKILDSVEADFEYIEDVSKASVEDDRKLVSTFIKPFDLGKAPLIRVKLVKRVDYYILFIDMHHIVGDGMSVGTFSKELNALYNGQALKPLTHQFKDYSEWMRTRDLSAQADYWKNEFDDEIPVLDMPLDFIRPQVQSYKGSMTSLTTSKELGAKIKELAAKNGTTEFMVFTSALMILLGKYSRQDDIVIGSPISGRTHRDTEEMLGMFVNTLALRGKPEANKTYAKFLTEIKETCLKAYENQEYPFEELVEAVDVQRDLSRSPIFDVMLVLQNNENISINLGGAKSEWLGSEDTVAKFDLTFNVGEYEENEFSIDLEYCADLYKKESAVYLLCHLVKLLEEITSNVEIKIQDIDVLSEEERTIIEKFNDTKVDYPSDKTIIEMFEACVERNPDNVAVVFENTSLTYRELNEKSNQVARNLREAGVLKDDLVAIISERSLEMMVGIWGVMKAGGAYVPIDPTYPEDRIAYMLDDCNPKTILVYKTQISDELKDYRARVIDLADKRIYEVDKTNLELVCAPDSLAYCIYTSGTTGRPKGVMIEHSGVINLAKFYIDEHKVNSDDKILMFANYVFDASITEIMTSLLSGAALYIASTEFRENTISLAQYIEEKGISIALLPPALFALMEVKGLRLVITAGAEAVRNAIEANSHIPVYSNDYGPTEGTVCATFWRYERGEVLPERIPIGKPIANKKIYIVNNGVLCGIGMPGELCIAGDGLARGYLNQPELTKEKFVDNPYGEGRLYHTGDLARWMPDGNIDYLGRIDEQVKIRGFRVELGEIESRIRGIAGIKDVAVIAREDASGEKAIYAYYVCDDMSVTQYDKTNGSITVSDIRDELSKNLPDYMIPSYMMSIESIPMTKNGKLDKKALPEIEAGTGKEYIAPRNRTESVICDIFKEIFNLQKVSVNDSFFELGGHSLRATRLVNQIEAETGVRIALKNVFSNATPEKLSRLVKELDDEEYVSIPIAEVKEYYPMSSAQKRIYFICEMDSDDITYNMPFSMKLAGEVRPDVVKYTAQKLIDRHEILRTEFKMIDGEPVQKILDDVEVDFEYIENPEKTDLVDIASVTNDEYDEKIVTSLITPFDLSKAPLVRVKLINRGDYHILFIDIHHIVGDGMSMATYTREFSALYNGEELKALTHQFKDYSEWMRTRDLSSQADYWKNEFDDEIPVLDMPVDFVRSQEQSYKGDRYRLRTGKELGTKIKELAAKNGATEFMVFTSALMVMLGKYSRQDDIIIGSPISGRTHKDTEEMLGMFVNTLALRGKPKADKTYTDFLAEIKDTCFKAYENQEYPFEELVEAVDVKRDLSRNPLFDVMLVVQNNENLDLSLNGVESRWIENKTTVAKFDLTFNIGEYEDGFDVNLEFCTALYEKDSAQLMVEHFIEVLEQLTENPSMKLAEVVTAGIEEQANILNVFNNTTKEYPSEKTIVELFEEQVLKTPDQIAVVYQDQSMTYAQLNAKANMLAHMLVELGIRQDDFVAMMTDRSLEMIIGIWGILKAGGAYVPMDPTYPEDRIQYMLLDCKPKAVLCYAADQTDAEEIKEKVQRIIAKNADAVPGAGPQVVDLAQDWVYGSSLENLPVISTVKNLAYCIYTSGTTGQPKGVLVEHGGVTNLGLFYIREHQINEKDKVLMFANYVFDASVAEVTSALLSGAQLHVAPTEMRMDTKMLEKYIREKELSIVLLPPVLLTQLNVVGPRLVITAGSESSKKILEQSKNVAVYSNDYGPTEGTVGATFWKYKQGDKLPDRIPIGKPISNKKVYIVANEKLCGIGVPGELCIAGVGIARGYLNRTELTAEKFVANPFGEGRMYHTGDLARWLPDGNIEYLGRIDEQVKIRGFRVELGEIESRIRELETVKNCAVIAKDDVNGEKAIYAYVVGNTVINISDIRSELGKTLPEYMIPGYLMQIESIPMTRNGKLDKRVLPDIQSKIELEYTAPKSQKEKALCESFEETLGIDRVGVTNSFFEIGGDSIKAIRVVSRMRTKGYTVSVKDIMRYKTPGQIAFHVSREEADEYDQGEIVGTVTETPIMRWFRLSQYARPEYFNQSTMLAVDGSMDEDCLRRILDALVMHHDILRAVYLDGELRILSYEESKKYDLLTFDLRGKDRIEELVYEECTKIQEGIRLAEGPLMRVALIETDYSKYVMICIHHYAVDGVSWRILQEDFDIAYDCIRQHKEIILPAKTASFIDWSNALREYSRSEELAKEKMLWDSFEAQKENVHLEISQDELCASEKNKVLSFELSEEYTGKLLRDCSKAYTTRINELLLAALGMAVKNLTGQDRVAVEMEGHGRETIHKKINIDRTVGWFTTTYPVVVDCQIQSHEAIIKAKEMLRKIPNNGIGYGLLYQTLLSKYIDLSFNYLGEMDSEEKSSDQISFSSGKSIADENLMAPVLSINSLVVNGKFVCSVTYNRCKDSLAERFIGAFKESLESVVGWCVAQKKKYITESDTYRLTPLQEGMYFHHKMDETDTSYFTQAMFRLNQRVRMDYLELTLGHLAEKYEELKTSFMETGSGVRQYIDLDKKIELCEKKFEEVYSETLLETYTSKDLERGFDLEKDSLVRVAILSFKDCDILAISSHHLIEDGWSSPIFYGDLVKIYNLYLKGMDEKQIQRMIQIEKQSVMPFRDYVDWIESIDEKEMEKYWTEYLEDYESVAEIAPIEAVETEKKERVAEYRVEFEANVSANLNRLAKENDATISTVMQTAVGLLLQKHCGTDDVLIGNVVSGRNVPLQGIENAVGNFINTVPLRIKVKEKNQTVLQLIKQIQEENNASSNYDHASLGGMKVSRQNVSDYIKHLFVFENYPDVSGDAEQSSDNILVLEYISIVEQTNYDLTFTAYTQGDNLIVRFEYDPSRFTTGNVELLGDHLRNIVNQMAQDPNRTVESIGTTNQKEEELILNRFNNTVSDYPKDKNVAELFEEQVRKSPDQTAITFENATLTYTELNAKANALAYKLRIMGVGPDDFVVIYAERSLEMIIGILGVLKSGGAYVPMDPTYPEDRIHYMLKDCVPKAVLYYQSKDAVDKEIEEKLYKAVQEEKLPVIDLADGKVYDGASENLPVISTVNNLAYCIYTSGTTGQPKGVMIEQKGVVSECLAIIKTFGFAPNRRVLFNTNIVFDPSVVQIFPPLFSGATIFITSEAQRRDCRLICDYMYDNHVDWANFAPMVLAEMLPFLKEKQSVKTIVVGGESLPSYLKKEVLGMGIELYNHYGPTEVTVEATSYKCESNDRNIIGKGIADKKIYILNGENLCGIGIPGELCITGDGLARGYLNQEDLTVQKFVENPFGEGRMYHTGDLARWLPDGNIEYLGRIDEQVKIRGFRIELGEIESRIRENKDVKDCTVIVRKDADGENAIYAYVVGNDDISISDIRSELGKTLPEYMIPAYMMQIDSIPTTRNGKIDKRSLPEIEAETGKEYVAPRNEMEEIICTSFCEILNLKQVGIKDSFFELGGHSLRATRLVNNIEEKTGHRIALKQIFSHQTPEQLAELITGAPTEGYVPIPKAEEKEYYPMSSAQKRTYLICQMDPNGILYNMPESTRIRGDINPEKLKMAVQKIFDRHEILRTRFVMMDGEPMQQILESVEAEFSYLKDVDTPEERLIADFVKPFDLSNPPLVRVSLVDRGDHYLLNIDMHHIVGDGMSAATFKREMNAIYSGVELAPLSHQFKDYSEWMRTRDLSDQATYWRSQFEDEVPVLDLPLDYKRPQEQSNAGARIGCGIGKELTQKIKHMVAENGVTDFMVFLSAGMILLSKYSRQEDIVIGTPISGRTHKDTEGMLGMFVNTLAMRGKPEGKKTYDAFLKEVKENCLKAYENQEYPFEELVEAVDVQRDLSRNPLFDVMLVLQNNEIESVNLGSDSVEYIGLEDAVAKFDLTFNIGEYDGEYSTDLFYCTALFSQESAEKMLSHYVMILEQLVRDTSIKIEQITTVDEKENEIIFKEFNNTTIEYPKDKTIVDLFEEQVRKNPDHTAVIFENTTLTYAELNSKANALALKLRDMGIGQDEFVAMMTERSVEMIIGILGVLKSGGAYVPMDTMYPEERIRYMLEDCKPKVILTYLADYNEVGEIREKIQHCIAGCGTQTQVIDLTDSRIYENASENLAVICKANDLAYCIYTSGTTGKPKGVLVEHGGVYNLASYMQDKLQISEKDRVMLFANYIFDGSVWEILSALMNGASLVIPTDETIKDINAMQKYVVDKKITVSYFPPAYYEQGQFALENCVITAGSAASLSSVRSILEKSNYINSYGPTEATVCISNLICNKNDKVERITIGEPISNVQVFIMQGDTLCGIGVPGELCVAGAGVARGYLNRTELTVEKFVHNPFGEGRMYHTGDLARWLPDGTIEYLGRVDEQVKIRGFRVELGEIESRIRGIEAVKDCAVIAKEDASGEKAIFAYVVSDTDINMSDIRNELGKNLPDYMLPSYMMQIETIPMTRNGKLDKRALPEIEGRIEGEYVAPRNEIEEVICQCFGEILGLDQVGIKDSFFELGGHSLRATRLVNSIEESIGLRIPLKDVFANPTPELLADLIQKEYEQVNKSEDDMYENAAEIFASLSEMFESASVEEMTDEEKELWNTYQQLKELFDAGGNE